MYCVRIGYFNSRLFLRTPRCLSTRAGKEKSRKTPVIRRQGEFLYGVAPCIAALQARRRKIYAIYAKPGSLEKKSASKRAALGEMQLHQLAEEMKADKHWVETSTLDQVTGHRPHQGIILDVAPLNFRRMDAMDCKLSVMERDKYPVWILLDEIQDPMNLGAILRVCYFLGVSRVITSLKRCCPLSPAVSKASAGAMEMMPVYSVSHLQNFLVSAKEEGWCILGTAGPNQGDGEEGRGGIEKRTQGGRERMLRAKTVDCRDFLKCGPTLLIIGNEGHGVHRELEVECDAILTVTPHRQLSIGLDSLNVAVATGILLHTLQRTSPINTKMTQTIQ